MGKINLIICFLLTYVIGNAQTKNFIDQPYLEVTGNADTLVTPNEIFIRIFISEKDTKDRTSVEELETKMVNAFKAMRIDVEKNLTTTDISSYFKSYFLKGKDVLKTKQYMLKVNDAPTATKIFIQLEDLGISNSSIDHVNHSALETIRNTIRTKAVENAKARAIALIKPLNQNLGTAIYIAEGESNNTGLLQGRAAGIMIRGYSTTANFADELPKIDFEKILVTQNVNVKFILK